MAIATHRSSPWAAQPVPADEPTDKSLANLTVPPEWDTLPGSLALGFKVLALALVGAWLAFRAGDIFLQVFAAVVGSLACLLGWVASRQRDGDTSRSARVLAFVAATGVGCLGLAVAGNVSVAVFTAVLALGYLFVVLSALRRRRRVARRIVWLAEGLSPITGDRRPLSAAMTPSWGSPLGLPVAWRYPPALTPDSKKLGEIEAVAAARVGGPVRITWGPAQAVIERRDDVAPVDPTDPAQGRLTAVLNAMIPGAKVTTLSKDNFGAVDRLEFIWPPERAVRVSPVAYRARVARALQGALGFPLTVEWDVARDRAAVAPLPPLPDLLPHPPRDDTKPMHVVFGQFRGGEPCVWDLDSTLPHVLIVGGTGGGKTVLLMTLLTGLPQVDEVRTQIYVIDPKRVGLKGVYGRVPGVHKPATTPAAFVDTLQTVQEEMDRRYTALEADRITRRELAPIVLFLDEGQEMYDVLKTWWMSGDGKEDWKRRYDLEKAPTGSEHPAMGLLGSILRLGREARVHVVLASQQAAASWLQTSSRGQFAVRIALRNLSVEDSRMIFGSPVATSGLESLPGRAWVATGLGAEPRHAQIFWTPKVERGLPAADREILHGLGVSLPDDDEPVTAIEPAASDNRAPHDGPDGMSPAAATDVPLDAGALEVTEEITVSALEDGMRVLVDTDDGPEVGTVESVDPDDADPEFLAVTYRLDSGEVGVLSLADDETVQLVG